MWTAKTRSAGTSVDVRLTSLPRRVASAFSPPRVERDEIQGCATQQRTVLSKHSDIGPALRWSLRAWHVDVPSKDHVLAGTQNRLTAIAAEFDRGIAISGSADVMSHAEVRLP